MKIGKIIFVCLGLAVMIGVAAAIYRTSMGNEFIFDDRPAIVENESIRAIWPLFGENKSSGPLNPKKRTPLTARPLVNLAFAIDYHFGELNPTGYRVAQTSMHVLAAAILWFIVASTLRRSRFDGKYDQAVAVLGFASAMLWMLHPLNSETVLFLTQRTELMMGLFYFLTLACCIGRWNSDRIVWRFGFTLLAILFCVLGILCKETMATAPLVILVYQWTFVESSLRRLLKSEWLFYCGLACCWIPITLLYTSGFVTPGGGFWNDIPATHWWLTQCAVVLLYLKLTFWPWPLVIHYEVPIWESLRDAWPAVAAVTALIGLNFVALWKRLPIGFVGVCFFIVLSPTLLIPLPGETAAERRMYVPLAAVVPYLLVAVYEVACRISSWLKASPEKSQPRIAPLVVCLVIATSISGTMAAVIAHRIPAYQNQLSIWNDAMLRQPENPAAWTNVGVTLAEQGKLSESLPYLEHAVALKPNYYRWRFNLAHALERLGRQDDSITQYRLSIKQKPGESATHYNLARVLEQTGRIDQAIEQYRQACRIDTTFAGAHTNLAILLAADQQWDEAIEHFESAANTLDDFSNNKNLTLAYWQSGRTDDAIRTSEKLQELAQTSAEQREAKQVSVAIGN